MLAARSESIRDASARVDHAPVDVVVITHNERLNLPHCLRALRGWTRRVFVVDSGSTDGTRELARDAGARVVEHAWEGYAAQKNWALENLPLEADWVLIVDADEEITPELREHIERVTRATPAEVPENGFFINRLTYFLGRPIHHCGYFPSWNLRLFRRGTGRYERREVHEHVVIDPPVGYIREPMIHHDRRGLEHFYAKHNRYSTLEARQLCREITGRTRSSEEALLTAQTRHRRWLKRHATRWVPFPSLWRFVYMYIWKLGVLDGRHGLDFCRFIAAYDGMVALKLRAMLRATREARVREHQEEVVLPVASTAGSSRAEEAGRAEDAGWPENAEQDEVRALAVREGEVSPEPAPPTVPMQMQPEKSPWTLKEKIGRALWMLMGQPLFRVSFHNWYSYRRLILRCFGARIGKRVAIRSTVNIEVPWMLRIDDDATVGDEAILYSLGRIHIGKRAIVSQYAHLCAGTHDYTDPTFKLLRLPITLEEDVWIGADAFVGPGVRIGRLAVLGARSSVYKNLPEAQVCVGNPARPIHARRLG